jgi:hypothetical protein
MIPRIHWPHDKRFAFTIFDDPDLDTAENVDTVYSFLDDLGFRTTKAVWPLRGNGIPEVGGATCQDEEYLQSILALHGRGFEIALHNVTYHSSMRAETIRGLEEFRRLFGQYPFSMANHTGCREGIYWGRARLSGVRRVIYDVLNLGLDRSKLKFQGHVGNSPFFWGDVCRDKIRFVRNFALSDINTLKACPAMPYHDSSRPYVNYWFAASEGSRPAAFNAILSESSQDRLAQEGGACIIYTHLASGFVENGKLNRRFKSLMKRLSGMDGWFVPVRALLDYILQVRGHHDITAAERADLESKWLWHKIFHTNGRS